MLKCKHSVEIYRELFVDLIDAISHLVLPKEQ